MNTAHLARALVIVFLGMFSLAGVTLISGCASTPRHEGPVEYLSSSTVTTDIKTRLLADPDIRSTSINVSTFKGKVIMSGFVDNLYQKQRALNIASHTKGVKMVIDNIRVIKRY